MCVGHRCDQRDMMGRQSRREALKMEAESYGICKTGWLAGGRGSCSLRKKARLK